MQSCKRVPPVIMPKTTVRKWWLVLIMILVVTMLLEYAMHPHQYFIEGVEATPWFNAWYGFTSCMAIVLFAKFLGLFLKERTTYYSEDDNE